MLPICGMFNKSPWLILPARLIAVQDRTCGQSWPGFTAREKSRENADFHRRADSKEVAKEVVIAGVKKSIAKRIIL